MQFSIIPQILRQEGTDFQTLDQHWRPQDLLYIQQVRALLRDMGSRYELLSAAESELTSLVRANFYLVHIRRMRLWLRKASFTWKQNQLVFLQAVSGFYTDYGSVLRFLKIDEAKGRFSGQMPVTQGV